jgi:hypothetical protein
MGMVSCGAAQVDKVWKLFGGNAHLFLGHTSTRFMAEMLLYANVGRAPDEVFVVTMGNFARLMSIFFYFSAFCVLQQIVTMGNFTRLMSIFLRFPFFPTASYTSRLQPLIP